MSREFLGKGWKFPVIIDGTTGKTAMSSYEQDIEESIRIILFTAKGERIMRPDFGCGLHDLAFETINMITIGMAESSVMDALIRWEPRIQVMEVKVSPNYKNPERLQITINYRVRSTNQDFNLVFPFYLK